MASDWLATAVNQSENMIEDGSPIAVNLRCDVDFTYLVQANKAYTAHVLRYFQPYAMNFLE